MRSCASFKAPLASALQQPDVSRDRLRSVPRQLPAEQNRSVPLRRRADRRVDARCCACDRVVRAFGDKRETIHLRRTAVASGVPGCSTRTRRKRRGLQMRSATGRSGGVSAATSSASRARPGTRLRRPRSRLSKRYAGVFQYAVNQQADNLVGHFLTPFRRIDARALDGCQRQRGSTSGRFCMIASARLRQRNLRRQFSCGSHRAWVHDSAFDMRWLLPY